MGMKRKNKSAWRNSKGINQLWFTKKVTRQRKRAKAAKLARKKNR